jgi:hypothetical protein
MDCDEGSMTGWVPGKYVYGAMKPISTTTRLRIAPI